ncbi:type I polyketide synthase [Providencia burhodogranariea]|uniref:Polyketide synthase type I n=1 Tax=Providencia burhodogranariea DSM 19968 TaxID=1141662 RepID=K8W6E9_9GAMM|nr:type I polyketide synthase [Providencia burhodogranariea]EKT53047.1 polyketide synthase type I [Providencia burhodogranariea DSM 19968]
MQPPNDISQKIALIGIACRFPGANDVETWWHNLINGVESLVALDSSPSENPDFVGVAAPLAQDIARFDAGFFGLSAREAMLMDPQHRLFLECAWHALENAGIVPAALPDTALFAGCSNSEYLRQNRGTLRFATLAPSSFEEQITNDKDYLSTRIAWHMGFGGPVMNVQAACATSLVAVCEAVYALRSRRCNIALAGACTLRIPELEGYFSQQGMIFAKDGHCRPFSADASGTVFGSGVGVVVMKRLEDALAAKDEVIAVIDGVAMNNDGAEKVSFTTTSLTGQQRLLRQALRDAQRHPEDFRAIETHGTGTLAGDPIEFSALNAVFREFTERVGFCALGAVKANVGHLETAAGMAGLIKAALQIKHGWLTPQINFTAANPAFDLDHSPFTVLTAAERWHSGDPRCAIGVSAFGIGGSNAHVVLTRPDAIDAVSELRPSSLVDKVVPISARSEQAWYQLTKQYRQLEAGDGLAALAWSAQTLRQGMRYRGTLGPDEEGKLVIKEEMLDSGKGRLSVVFQFPGQGSQFIGMARELMAHDPIFHDLMLEKMAILRQKMQIDISILFSDEGDSTKLNNTSLTQPTLIAVEISLAELLMHYGVVPDCVLGHSVGEIAAAWLVGAFSIEQALIFASQRGRLMSSLEGGSMLAVELSESDCQPWLGREISLAAVNSENSSVLSGSVAALADCKQRLDRASIRYKSLSVSHAFHSASMDPILSDLHHIVPTVNVVHHEVRYYSTLLAQEVRDLRQLNADYWCRHARETVRYHQTLQQIPDRGKTLFIEVGPGSTLTALVAKLRLLGGKTSAVRTLRRYDDSLSESALWVKALQKIWRAGVDISWSRLWTVPPRRVTLPLYPFDHQYWWMGDRELPVSPQFSPNTDVEELDVLMARINQLWHEVTGALPASAYQDFYDSGGQSLMALRLMTRLEQEFGVAVSMADFLQQPTPSGLRHCLQKSGVVE